MSTIDTIAQGAASPELRTLQAQTLVDVAALEARASALEGSTSSIFGDGDDGTIVFDGTTTLLGLVPSANTYTLTRDIYLAAGTVNTGVTIYTAGFRIFCAGTLTTVGTGAIHNNGHDAVADTAGAITNASGSTGAGTAGGAGRAGSSGVGVAGTNTAIGFPGLTGAGGAGGGDGTNAGGAGGTFTALAAVKGGARQLMSLITGMVFGTQTSGVAGLVSLFGGGAGGGGGATDNADGTAGGGGGGGGICFVAAHNLVHAGTISADGGIGADGTSAANNAGGGGGGMGGLVIVITRTSSGAGTFTAAGGAGGAAAGGAGVAGSAGEDGLVIQASA